MRFLKNLDDVVHQAILKILSEFSKGDRYSNIDLILGAKREMNNPIALWFRKVDIPLFEKCISKKKKNIICRNTASTASMLAPFVLVRHTSETGSEIIDLEDASHRTGMQKAVAPYRQRYVLQIIRYWVELLTSLQRIAMQLGNKDVPYFSEVFALFYSNDSYFRKRKVWNTI